MRNEVDVIPAETRGEKWGLAKGLPRRQESLGLLHDHDTLDAMCWLCKRRRVEELKEDQAMRGRGGVEGLLPYCCCNVMRVQRGTFLFEENDIISIIYIYFGYTYICISLRAPKCCRIHAYGPEAAVVGLYNVQGLVS